MTCIGHSTKKRRLSPRHVSYTHLDVYKRQEEHGDLHRVEAVLGARFPGINKKLGDFNFKRHYGCLLYTSHLILS